MAKHPTPHGAEPTSAAKDALATIDRRCFHVIPDGETQGATFHVIPDGETTPAFATGFLIGLLVGEGHFGGDGRQPHVTLRMHTDHEQLFRWIETHFPGGRLYGPYTHGGRSYYQWMARGEFLKETLLPLLERHLTPELDGKAYARYEEMKRKYRLTSSAGPTAAGS